MYKSGSTHITQFKYYLLIIIFSKNKKHSSPSTNRREKDQSVNQTKTVHTKRWEEGVVVRLSSGQDFGFITPENTSYGKDVFFHRRCLVNKGQFPRVNDRVQFYISSTKKGYEANEIRVQVEVYTILTTTLLWVQLIQYKVVLEI